MKKESATAENKQEIINLMQQINSCWLNNQTEILARHFHEDIIFNSPDLKFLIVGKNACIKTYNDFLQSTTVLLFKVYNTMAQVFEGRAIISYTFEMKYVQKEKTQHETGTDIIVFNQCNDEWKAVWRLVTNLKNL